MTRLSEKIRDLPATGSVNWQYNALTLTGTGAALEVFNVAGSQLCTPTGTGSSTTVFNLNGVDSDATVLINVDGSALACSGFWMNNNYNERHVLFNFHQASSLTLSNLEFRGSILAVNADLGESVNGLMSGQVFAKSWKALNANCMQQRWSSFEGKQIIFIPSLHNLH